MLVMDENRYLLATEEGLADLRDMLRRDRNHPSIVMWSMCNEEFLQGTEVGTRILQRMVRLTREMDPSRPTICAVSGSWDKSGYSTATDLMGCNYNHKLYDEYHTQFPGQPMVGSETASSITTRGIYADDKESGYLSAYDLHQPGWGAFAEEGWKPIAERPFVAGTFVWTGFDYRGEPTPYAWPCISSHFGIMDTCGFPKDNFYYYQAWWQAEPVLHILPHWNWPGREGEEIEVWVHSNCERVELFLNGESLGAQELEPNGHLEWQVKYAPGALLAKGYRGGVEVATELVETTTGPVGLTLAPDRQVYRADGEDVAVVAVGIVDAQGRLVPVADQEIRFAVSGGARILGVGNGDPSSHEPDRANRRRAFGGRCQVLVQMGREAGEVVLTASSPGLMTQNLTLTAEACEARPYLGFLDQAQTLTTWRRSPVLAEEPAGNLAPPEWDQNAWQQLALGSGAESEAGAGWVAYRVAAQVPAYEPKTETLALRLAGLAAATKVYLNGLLAGETSGPGDLTVPVEGAAKAPLAVTLVVRQAGASGDPVQTVTFERKGKE
jgi:beta-galactosidase